MSRFLLLLLPLLLLISCDPDSADDEQATTDNFDRQEMLAGWADNVVTPAYNEYLTQLAALQYVWFQASGTDPRLSLADVRVTFDETYRSWQNAAPLLIDRAENFRLRERTNTYPTNTELIEENIRAGNANLALPSQTAAQGLPALDYLFYGPDSDNLLEDPAAVAYVGELIGTLTRLMEEVRGDFVTYRDAFVANDGNSATASIDRAVNNYIFYYEKFLRAGKVGIPAGVFSDDPLADRVESLYGGNSRVLFADALVASERFFLNHGLADYLDALNVTRDGEALSQTIRGQFAAILNQLAAIDTDFATAVRTDNTEMLRLYDELQRLTVLLKVDMLQALSINVDYVDADGD